MFANWSIGNVFPTSGLLEWTPLFPGNIFRSTGSKVVHSRRKTAHCYGRLLYLPWINYHGKFSLKCRRMAICQFTAEWRPPHNSLVMGGCLTFTVLVSVGWCRWWTRIVQISLATDVRHSQKCHSSSRIHRAVRSPLGFKNAQCDFCQFKHVLKYQKQILCRLCNTHEMVPRCNCNG